MNRGILAKILERPVSVFMLLCTLLVLGVVANAKLGRQLFPSGFVAETISINVPVVDSTPKEVMDRVSIPTEDLLRTIPGVTRIRSWSRSSGATLRVEFGQGEDADLIYADIRDRMERLLPTFPEGSDRYFLFRFNLEADVPVMWTAITFPEEGDSSRVLLENVILPRIESVDGVARVEALGLVGKQVTIELIPELVAAHNVDVVALIGRLQGENIIAPGGPLEDGGRRALLRVSQRFDSLDDIRELRVNDSLLLGDIAQVELARGLDEFLVRMDGELCQLLRVFKESDANAVDVCSRLRDLYSDELSRDPRLNGFEFEAFFDSGKTITMTLSSLQSTCLWGGLLALLVLYGFLRRARLTLLVSAAIPLSLLIALVVIYFRGGTLNFLSMTGLTIAIGMLIDNAIVVSENIFRWREKGLGPREAAARGVQEVALAVTLATLTTVAVFVPLIFLGSDSVARTMLRAVGLPVCYSLLASLFVALVFVPTGAAQLPTAAGTPRRARGGPSRADRTYRRILIYSLRHPLPTLLIIGLLSATTVIPAKAVQTEGKKGNPSGDHYVEVDFPRSTSLREADEIMETLRVAVEPLRSSESIESITVWFDSRNGTLAFFLEPGMTAQREVFLEKIRPLLPELPGVEYEFNTQGDEDRNLVVNAIGRDPVILADLLDQVAARVKELPEVLEVATPGDERNEEIAVVLERERAQRFDVSAERVSSLIGWMLRGAPLPDFALEGEEVPFWIRFLREEEGGFDELSRVEIFNDAGDGVPLTQVAHFEIGRSLPTIRRTNRQVSSGISVTFRSGVDLKETEPKVRAIVDEVERPEGYEFGTRGGLTQFRRDAQDFATAGLLGMILIFLIMGVLFESLILPLCVLGSLPFLFVGANWSCWIFGETLTQEGLVGFVILVGVVVNNAIVLIDCINRMRGEGLPRSAAIVEASRARLRPILMTAMTTVCGLLPLIVAPNEGSGVNYRPLAVVVLGGLTSATLFTLVAVPLFYRYLDDLRFWGRDLLRWGRRGRAS